MYKVLAVVSLFLFLGLSAIADDRTYGPINVSSTASSGDQVRGPIKVKLIGVNVIQRNVQIGVNVTYPAGPDLSLPFIPPIPKAGAQTTPSTNTPGNPTQGATSTVNNARNRRMIERGTLSGQADVGIVFDQLIDKLNDDERTRFGLQTDISDLIDNVNRAASGVTSFVTSPDTALAADPTGSTLLPRISALLSGLISNALSTRWPSSGISTLEGNLAVLKNSLVVLPDNQGWTTWVATASNKSAYDAAVTRVNDLIGLAASMESSTNKSASTLADSQNKLQQWQTILTAIAGATDPFSRTVDISCSFGFANSKNTLVQMIATDRLAPASTAAAKQEIVTVICSSPLSISAGFGFSTVHERPIAFIQSLNSSNQVVSVFGYKARSNFKPLPLLMLNTRLWEWNDNWALHVSNGAVVDIKTGATTGTDVEYVSGLSFSYKRSLFMTVGFHAGRTQELTGDFTIGQQVPTSVNTPPVQNHWSPGAIFGFTYRLK